MDRGEVGPGDRVGRYEILDCVASGGMGDVYRARDAESGALVAIKLMSALDGAPQAGARFEREARVLSTLRHPGIVGYVAHGVAPSRRPYLAMEWLEGEDLAARIARGPLAPAEAVLLLRRAAEALAVAHAQGVVHRDLKPSNLFLRGGRIEGVTLLDFGLARFLERSMPMTRTGVIIGTPGYMAPEQVLGERELTPAADVFSLGCVFFQCLTGAPPFGGADILAILGKIVFEDAPRLATINPDLPPELDALLERMLAKGAGDRLCDGAAVLAALDGLQPAGAPAERQLTSVVMALPGEQGLSDAEGLEDLKRILLHHGARLEVLPQGLVVAVLRPARGSATDLAARAARCALLLRAQWPAAHIALGTGQGAGVDVASERDVFARTAALLRHAAAASSPAIVLDEATSGLLEVQFVVQRTASGVHTLTGEELPLDESRRLLGSPTPCVGRNVELGMLDTVLSTCFEEREPRMVLVTGAAGAGKSRLRHELMRRAAQRAEPPVVLFGRGEPLATSEPSAAGSSYRTLGQAIRRLCDIRDDDDDDARRAKLAGRVGAHVPDDERPRVVQFVGELAGVHASDEGQLQLRAARQDPVLMSDQLHLAMLDFLRAECAAHPVLVVLEDIQWADAASVKLVESAARALKGAPLAALMLARPEANQLFPGLWTGGAHVMPLGPLAKRAREQLVRHVLGTSASASVVARIVEQSDGNPLFLEELIRGAAAGRGEETPETVLAILQARIGRLDAGARRVLRAASVYGETARTSGVAAVLGEPRGAADVEGWLARLTAEEILEVRGTPRPEDDAAYRFRHALVRDAAYDTLGDAQRAEAHRLAAEYLEANRDAEPFVLAEHFRQGAAPDRAVPYYIRAAEQAYDTADTDAMARSADGGLRSGAQGRQRGELLSFRVAERFARERYPEVFALAGEAMQLLAPGDRPWSRVLGCLIPSLAMTSQIQPVAELVERLEGVEPTADARAEFIRCVTWASVLFGIMGAKRLSRAFLERTRHVASACDPSEIESLAVLRACEGNDTHVVEELPWTGLLCQGQSRDAFRAVGNQRLAILMTSYYGKVLGDLGDVAAAEAELRENLAHAERLGEEFSLAYARVYLARLVANEALVDRLDEPARLARAVIASGNATLRPVAHAALAQILRRRGRLAEADVESQRAVEAVQPFPGYAWEILAQRARILTERGRGEEALEVSEAGVRRLEELDMEGHGELALRLALVEARDAAGRRDAAKEMLARSVERLRKRIADIPGPADRARYLTAVAVNARLSALAREWGVGTLAT